MPTEVSGIPCVDAVTKTANYTMVDETAILADAAGGALTVTLPSASSVPGGIVVVKRINVGVNLVTVAGQGSDTIEGMASQTLAAQFASLMLMSDGVSRWLKLSAI